MPVREGEHLALKRLTAIQVFEQRFRITKACVAVVKDSMNGLRLANSILKLYESISYRLVNNIHTRECLCSTFMRRYAIIYMIRQICPKFDIVLRCSSQFACTNMPQNHIAWLHESLAPRKGITPPPPPPFSPSILPCLDTTSSM